MHPITVLCGACNQGFIFEHPSVRVAVDIMNVTIDCHHCGVVLMAPKDSLRMEPLEILLTKTYRSAGVEISSHAPQVGFITLTD